VSGIALFDVAVVVALVLMGVFWLGFRGGGLTRARRVHLRCPRKGEEAEATLVQDVRVGQYRDVLVCSLLEDPYAVTCDQECRRLLNLGHPPERLPAA
jgi:hypothetical protein